MVATAARAMAGLWKRTRTRLLLLLRRRRRRRISPLCTLKTIISRRHSHHRRVYPRINPRIRIITRTRTRSTNRTNPLRLSILPRRRHQLSETAPSTTRPHNTHPTNTRIITTSRRRRRRLLVTRDNINSSRHRRRRLNSNSRRSSHIMGSNNHILIRPTKKNTSWKSQASADMAVKLSGRSRCLRLDGKWRRYVV